MAAVIDDDMFTGEAVSDPYTYLAKLREQDPVHWNEIYGGWVVTRHDDLVWISRHHELFSNEFWKRDTKPAYPAIDESEEGFYKWAKAFFTDIIIQKDRPVHTDHRRVVHKWFNPNSMELWRPMVQSVVEDMLDEAEQSGRMDVMRDFATPLPLFVIAQMMGIPVKDRRFIRSIAEKLVFISRGGDGRMKVLTEALQELVEYMSPMVEEKVSQPVDENNLLSVLCSGEKTGVLTRDEVVADAIMLLSAGHETSINLLCNGILALTRHPDQWQLLKHDAFEAPDAVVRATEECLRYDPPIKSIQRLALEDVELRGKLIREGDRVRWFISSANRDPGHHENPDQFDISRWPNTHVAFGSGIHHCLGATLARMEAQEAFKALAERYDSINLETDQIEYQPSIVFRSIVSLPVSMN